MSDIVERPCTRWTTTTQFNRAENVAVDEIERLRKELNEAAKLNMELMAIRSEQDAEIKRLREQLSRFERCYVAVDDVLKAKNRDAEIERLRAALRNLWSSSSYSNQKLIDEVLGNE